MSKLLDILGVNETPVLTDYVLTVTKENFESTNHETSSICKILKFSHDLSFDEILVWISRSNCKDYPKAFIFIIDLTKANDISYINILKRFLIIFDKSRSLILQLTIRTEQDTQFFYKEDNSEIFVDFNEHLSGDSNDFDSFSSFLWLYLNRTVDLECLTRKHLKDIKNSSLLFKFIQTLEINFKISRDLLIKCAAEGSVYDFLAAGDGYLDDNEIIFNQYYLNCKFGSTSILMTAIQHSNQPIIEFLIKNCSPFIQQLSLDHQIEISTYLFINNKLDILCDLLEQAEFPFPVNLNSALHPKLLNIIHQREMFHNQIQAENLSEIEKFAGQNPNIKYAFDAKNKTALFKALELKKYKAFFLLKSLRFCDHQIDYHDDMISDYQDKKFARTIAFKQGIKNVNESSCDRLNSVLLLQTRSLIYSRISNNKDEIEQRTKIRKWLEDIYKTKFGSALIDAAAQCEELKIIFDFNSDSVQNIDPSLNSTVQGVTYPVGKFILIGAKSSGKKEQEQRIKIMIANEICHYVMNLVYQNNFNAYYNNDKQRKDNLSRIVDDIKSRLLPEESDLMSYEEDQKDDECDGIISSVYKFFRNENWHTKIVTRPVLIQVIFASNENKLMQLENMYKHLFEFFERFVIPELKKFNLKHRKNIQECNKLSGLLKEINKLHLDLSNPKDLSSYLNKKLAIISTNIPRMLMVNIYKNLRETYGDLYDSRSIFLASSIFENSYASELIENILRQNQELNVIVHYTTEIRNIKEIVNSRNNFIFIVSNKSQQEKLICELNAENLKDSQYAIDYKWMDLTDKSKKKLLKTKVNFQNCIDFSIFQLLANQNSSILKLDDEMIIDDYLLNLLLEKSEVVINKDHEDYKHFNVSFQARNLIRMPAIEIHHELANNQKLIEEKLSLYQKAGLSKENDKKETNKELNIVACSEIIEDTVSPKYVLISDKAGSGKSWIMKNIANIMKQKYPNKWITFIDLKQYFKEYKSQGNKVDFITFMVEKIMKNKTDFELEIFKILYKNGKVCVFADGFDEIAPDYAQLIMNLFIDFQQNGGNQLWIATRDLHEEKLRRHLGLDITYKLDEYTEEEGIDLIASNWLLDETNSKKRPDKVDQIKFSSRYKELKFIAQTIVEKIPKHKEDSQKSPCFYKMIADVTKNNNFVARSLSVFKILEEVIKAQYEKWLKHKGELRLNENISSQDRRLNFHRLHELIAMASVFPKKSSFCDLNKTDLKEWTDEEIIGCGMLAKIGEKFVFMDKNLRDFFVARFILRILMGRSYWPGKNEVFEHLVKILTEEKFMNIRLFLNGAFEEELPLMLFYKNNTKMFDYIYGHKNADELFGYVVKENHENIIRVLVKVLNYGNNEIVKKYIGKIILNSSNKAQLLKICSSDLLIFYDMDLKDLMTAQELIDVMIKPNTNIEMFGEFFEILRKHNELKSVQDYILNVAKDLSKENIFFSLSKLPNLNKFRVEQSFKILETFLSSSEMLKLIYTCNENKQNILHLSALNGNIVYFWNVILKYFERNDQIKNFKEFVKNQDSEGKTVLHHICNKGNTYLEFLNQLITTFKELEELKDFILIEDKYKNNFIHELIRVETNISTIELTMEILEKLFAADQYKEILMSKGLRGINLLQSAVFWSENVQLHQLLWKKFYDIFNVKQEFVNYLNQVNDFSQNIIHIAVIKSSGIIVEFIIEELSKMTTFDEIIKMLESLDDKRHNLLQMVAKWDRNLDVASIVWSCIKKYFNQFEIQDMIKHFDISEKNLLFITAEKSEQKILEFTWNEIKFLLNYDEQIEMLKTKNIFGQHILSIKHKDPHTKTWLYTLFDEYNINPTLLDGHIEVIANSGISYLEPINENLEENHTEVLSIENNANNFKIYWRAKSDQSLYMLDIKDIKLADVCRSFIISEMKGEIKENPLLIDCKNINIQDMVSDTGMNLLIFAARESHHNVIKNLLAYNFDIDFEDNKCQNAIDNSWINYKTSQADDAKMKAEDIMLHLLEANSKYPKEILKFNFDEAPKNVKDFITKCENMHDYLINDEIHSNEIFLNNSLRYFYDRYNKSLLLHALKLRKADFIKTYGKYISIRKDEVYYELTRDPRTEFISKQEITKPHIILLKSKSEICGRSYQNCNNWVCIDNIYKLLDKSEVCSKVLRIVAENSSLKIFFVPKENDGTDVNRATAKKAIFNNKHIYIAGNVVLEQAEGISSNFVTYDDEITIANDVIESLCHVAISMLCLDNFKINKLEGSVAYDEDNIDKFEDKVRKVFNTFNEFLFDYFQKLDIGEIIFILRTLQSDDKIINYQSLPESMQQRILESIVDFQGVEVEFSSIIDNNFEILTHLTSKSIRDIILRNTNLKMGKNYKIDYNYDILEREIDEYTDIASSHDSSSESKISILADDFGSGKTAKLKSMSVKLKQSSKSSWICLIKLTDSSKILQKYLNQNVEIDKGFIINLLKEVINLTSKLEAEVLNHLFSRNKIILLIDDIDKIDANLSEFVIKVIAWINQNSSNEIWITTCPVFLHKFENQLNAKVYKFYRYRCLSYYRLIFRFFRELKNVDDNFKTPDELTSFVLPLFESKSGMLNCGMIQAIVEVYIENEADFQKKNINIYVIHKKIHQKQQNVFKEYLLNESNDQFEEFSIQQVYQVHALLLILKDISFINLDNLAIMKKWSREQKKWPKERIGRYGFICFDNIDFHFIHHSYAEFFLAEYIISYIYSNDYCIKDEEFEKIFKIIKYMTQNIDDFEIVLKFIIGYAKTMVDNGYDEIHETMRNLIDKNIEEIQNDIALSKNIENLIEFWACFVKNDDLLSRTIKLYSIGAKHTLK